MSVSPRPRLLAALTAALIAATLLIAAPAQAQPATVTCTAGSTQLSFTPGLTLATQSVQVSELDIFANCGATDPTIQSGVATFNGPVPLSCVQLLDGFQLAGYTIQWNNGQASVITAIFTVTTAGGVLTSVLSGVVTSGAFAGGSVTINYTYVQPNLLACLTAGGLMSMTGSIPLATIV